MRRTVSQARRRGYSLPAWLGVAGLVLVTACGSSPLSSRYQAELALWKAGVEERRGRLNPVRGTEAGNEILALYQRILQRYPLSSATGDPAAVRDLARVRLSAARSASRIFFQQGQRQEAIAVLSAERAGLRGDAAAAMELYRELSHLLATGESPDSLAALYREMMATFPAARSDGHPDPTMIEVPIRLGDLYVAAGRAAEAAAAQEEAIAWYDRVAAAHAGAPVQVAALVKKADVLARQRRAAESAAVLDEARALPQAAAVEEGILYSQGLLHEVTMGDPRGAIPYYRELLERHGDGPRAGQVILRLGVAYAAVGRADSSQAQFDRAEREHGRDLSIASEARALAARLSFETGDTGEAIRRLRALAVDYPRTSAGLRAPLDLAAIYARANNREAETATLREAAQNYERLASELARDPAQAQVVYTALELLADARFRLEEWSSVAEALVQRAGAFPNSPASPLALIQAAGIHEQRLSDTGGALRILKLLDERYPGHPLTREARTKAAQLEGLGS